MTLCWGHATPHAEAFFVVKRSLKTLVGDRAFLAYRNGAFAGNGVGICKPVAANAFCAAAPAKRFVHPVSFSKSHAPNIPV